MKLILDKIEDKIRHLLLQYSREFTKSGNPEVTLRFTGGWVRDKILGRPSHDIDVAIDKCTGEEFATGLHNYMIDIGIDETGVHKIAVNPEKSKHLETATTRICGLDVDFVNLRSEEYANSDSRVPSAVKFGTPEEDALRRDATLNALFYNLTTGMVEDFTGRGLSDLKQGILRTPLDATETFNDDPLRVLRLLRFVGQLGFTIAPETLQAMEGKKIGDKLLTKVSGERMGTELLKLVQSDHAADGLKYLIDLGLGEYVLNVPGKEVSCSTRDLERRYNSLVALEQAKPALLNPTSPAVSRSEQGMLWLSTLLQDLYDEDPSHNYVSEIIQERLKLTRQAKDGCIRLVRSAEPFDNLRRGLINGSLRRRDLGGFVRNFGDLWKLCLVFNAARLAYANEDIATATSICEAINKNKLETAYELKPLLAGKQLMQLTSRKPGPWLQQALQQEIDFQLDHPEAGLEDVKQYMLEILKN